MQRIGQEQLAREWSKEYDGSGSKLEKLKEASYAAYEDAAVKLLQNGGGEKI